MKTYEYGGMDIQIHVLLTSELVGSEWSALRLWRFTTGTHWIGSWVGHGAIWMM
jgi:hypothetical protein